MGQHVTIKLTEAQARYLARFTRMRLALIVPGEGARFWRGIERALSGSMPRNGEE